MTPLPFRKHPGVARNDKMSSSATSSPVPGTSHPPSSFNAPVGDTRAASIDSPNAEYSEPSPRGFARLLRRRPSLNARPSTSDDGGSRDEGTPLSSGPPSGLFGRNRPGSASGTASPRKPASQNSPSVAGGSIPLVSPVFAHDGLGPQKPTTKRSQRADHPFFISARRGSLDDDTDLTPAPIFHHSAGLSPTRRAMPRSPRAPRTTPKQPIFIPSQSMHGSTSDSSPTTSSSFSATKPSPLPNRPTVTAEWLSKKPTPGRRVESPKSLGGAAHIRNFSGSISKSARVRTTSLSSGASAEASTSGVDSEDGEVGIKSSRRRSQISSTRDGSGSYQVEVLCVDNRNEGDEMKWEVTIRRRQNRTSGHSGSSGNNATGEPSPALPESQSSNSQAPTSPMNLSTTQSVAQAPSAASSINLSLSLDQPTGKLVFIAFPMDLHATPRRRPSKSSRTPARSPRSVISPRPSTPPLSNSVKESERPETPTRTSEPSSREYETPPPAPNPNDASPPRTPPQPYHRRVSQNSLWPSPSRSGHRSPMRTGSPTRQSPAEVWTPRRTRMVSARELDGGLYAPGTVDGMSEDLEKA